MGEKVSLFELLLDQIQLTDDDWRSYFSQGQLEQVDILAASGEWQFHIRLPERVTVHAYEVFHHYMDLAFEHICTVNIWWHHDQESELSSAELVEYWQALVHVLSRQNPYLKACLSRAQIAVQADKILSIGLTSQNQVYSLQESYLPLLNQRLEQLGLEEVALEFYVDEALSQSGMEEVAHRISEEDERNLLEALQAQEQREQQAAVSQPQDVEPIGKDIPPTSPIPMVELDQAQFKVVVEGHVFSTEIKELRTGNQLLIMGVTDYSSSITVKLMSGRGVTASALKQFNKGDWLRFEGDVIPDNYTSELYLRPRSIRHVAARGVREDSYPAEAKRVELHAHTQMTVLDATNSATDIIQRAADWGHPAVAITDKGGVQAFPEAYRAGQAAGIKVIYGLEANLVNDGEPVAFNPTPVDLKEATYVVFDVETTGLSSVYDKIIELAAVKMKQGNVIDSFESFVNPHQTLSAFTTELTGITDAMVQDAPEVEAVLRDFKQFCEGAIIVAHNATFDIGFINQGYERIGLSAVTEPVIDTLELSRTVNPELKSHRLNTLAKRYGIELTQHHRAIYDSETTGYLCMKLLEQAADQFGMVRHQDLNNQLGQGDSYKQGRPQNALLLVKNQAGLKDLFKLVSASNVNYYYRVPRIPKSLLAKHRDHLYVGTADSGGEVFTAMMQKGYDEAKRIVAEYDFIELQPRSVYQSLVDDDQLSSMEDVDHIMQELIRLGEETGKLVVATGDVHYLDERDAIYREVVQSSLKVNANRQLNLPLLHFRTTDEMMQEFAHFGEELAYDLVIRNPQRIADSIEDVEVTKKDLYTPNIEGSDEEITQMSYQQAHEIYGDALPELVEARIKRELDSIISNGFSVIYLISQKLVQKSNENGYLVGSRGSVGSSLVATLTGITEVNPLPPHYYCPQCHFSEFFTEGGAYKSGYDLPDKDCPECGHALAKEGQDIPFETFLGFNGDKVPDIDLNFSGDFQSQAHAYTKVLFGEDYVFRAGTIGTVAQKTALGYVRGYMEHTGKYLPQAERERLATGIEGIKRTTGQHPGGIVVIPDYMDVYDFTPIQYPADDNSVEWRTTHFDFHSIDENVLKLDILGHDDPTMIRMLSDLSGIQTDDIPFIDSKVMEIFSGTEVLGVTPEQIFSDTGTLGVPEFGTPFVRGMIAETKPTTFAELLQISGLSHGTDVWLGNAQELIRNKVVPLSEVIGCRDDIMVTLIQYGLEDGLAFKIMEHVRKGRGIPDDWQDEMRAHQVPEWYIDSCLKIKYMFPKAHAAAYVMMALRIAYFKVYYPIIYYAAYFSVRAKDFDIVAMHQGKEVVKRRIREINDAGYDASNKDNLLLVELEIANEMLERGYHFQMVNLDKSDAHDFVIEGNSLIPPFRAIPGLGLSVARQIVAAREEAPFLSKEDLQIRGKVSKTLIAYMTEHDIISHLPDEDQLSLF